MSNRIEISIKEKIVTITVGLLSATFVYSFLSNIIITCIDICINTNLIQASIVIMYLINDIMITLPIAFLAIFVVKFSGIKNKIINFCRVFILSILGIYGAYSIPIYIFKFMSLFFPNYLYASDPTGLFVASLFFWPFLFLSIIFLGFSILKPKLGIFLSSLLLIPQIIVIIWASILDLMDYGTGVWIVVSIILTGFSILIGSVIKFIKDNQSNNI